MESNYRENMLATFKGEFKEVASDSRHNGHYFATLMSVFFIVNLIMSLATFYSKTRSTNQQNHVRYNVFTLNWTLFWGLIHFMLFIPFWVSLNMEQIQVFSVIRFFLILSQLIKSLVALFENKKHLPELFSDMETNIRPSSFNMTPFHPTPRQETFMPIIPFRQDARYKSQ